MLEALDRVRRDSTLFQFTSRRMRDFLNPNHILIKIDEEFDFEALVKPLEGLYCPDNGRPAIHPEVIVRALLISALYNITSFRQLCHAISENLAFRWFLFLTIDDEVFDHSTITYFIERIGREGFKEIFERLNEELLRLGLLSPRVYADSSLVRANVSSTSLEPSGLKVEEFAQRAVEDNGIFTLKGVQPAGEGEPAKIQVSHYQDPQGKLPLNPVDLDARWSTHSRKQKAQLCHKDNIIVDKSGFILARSVSHANLSDIDGITPLVDMLPLDPSRLTADAQYNSGAFRQGLRDRGIQAYIPLHPKQERAAVVSGGFKYQEREVICPQGKVLSLVRYDEETEQFRFAAKRADCRECSQKGDCLPTKGKYKSITVSRYYPLLEQALETKASARYRREMKRRKVVVEGVFAHLDQLGWDRCKLRGLCKVDCEGYIAALAHNLLKALTKVRWKRRVAMALTLRGRNEETEERLEAISLQAWPAYPPNPFHLLN